LTRGDRSARGAGRIRRDARRRRRSARLGLDRGDPLHGAAAAARGNAGLERRTARRARHARFHDRHGIAANAMNTVHDMGGQQNYGAVAPEADEPVFHHDWERRVLAMNLAMGATKLWNIDQGRAAVEKLPPAQYVASSYYEKWF